MEPVQLLHRNDERSFALQSRPRTQALHGLLDQFTGVSGLFQESVQRVPKNVIPPNPEDN
jgi:hypothetical protein